MPTSNIDKPLIILIPGVNHTATCFDRLTHNLAQLGWTDILPLDPSVVPAEASTSLAAAAAATTEHCEEQFAGRQLVLVGHSMGSAIAAHIEEQLPEDAVLAVVGIAPVGLSVPKMIEVVRNLVHHAGIREAIRMFGSGNLPITHPGVRQMLYGDDLSEQEQELAQSLLIYPDPRTLRYKLSSGSFYPKQRTHRHHTALLGYTDDQLVPPGCFASAKSWWQPNLSVVAEGSHNKFMSIAGARFAGWPISQTIEAALAESHAVSAA